MLQSALDKRHDLGRDLADLSLLDSIVSDGQTTEIARHEPRLTIWRSTS